MGDHDFTLALYQQANEELPPETDWEDRKAHLEKRFAQTPDILARISNNSSLDWDNDDRLRLFKAVRDDGTR